MTGVDVREASRERKLRAEPEGATSASVLGTGATERERVGWSLLDLLDRPVAETDLLAIAPRPRPKEDAGALLLFANTAESVIKSAGALL